MTLSTSLSWRALASTLETWTSSGYGSVSLSLHLPWNFQVMPSLGIRSSQQWISPRPYIGLQVLLHLWHTPIFPLYYLFIEDSPSSFRGSLSCGAEMVLPSLSPRLLTHSSGPNMVDNRNILFFFSKQEPSLSDGIYPASKSHFSEPKGRGRLTDILSL